MRLMHGLVFLGIASLATSGFSQAWTTQAGNYARTNFTPQVYDLSKARELWRKPILFNSFDPHQPIASGSIVYFSYRSLAPRIDAVQVKTGDLRWSTPRTSVLAVHQPTLAHGQLYYQSKDFAASRIQALDPSSGLVLWDRTHPAQNQNYFAGTAVGTTMYFPSGFVGGITRYNPDGSFQWINAEIPDFGEWTAGQFAGWVWVFTNRLQRISPEGVATTTAVDGSNPFSSGFMGTPMIVTPTGTAFAGRRGEVLRLNLLNGTIATKVTVLPGFAARNEIALDGNEVFSLGFRKVLSLNPATLATNWEVAFDDIIPAHMLVTRSHIFLSGTAGSGQTIALNRQTRQVDWRYFASGPMALADDRLYIATNSERVAIQLRPEEDRVRTPRP